MTTSPRTDDLLKLMAGSTTDAEVAAKHGVTVEEVREWRRLFADGLSLQQRAARTSAPMRWLIAAGVVTASLVSTLAVGQVNCPQTLPSPLKTFCADSPAMASEVNGNFQQLVNWSRQKLGTEGSPDINSTGSMNFGATTRQMINLWSTEYAIGVQNSTSYFRTGGNFAWFRGGSHNNGTFDPGGGAVAMRLDSASNLTVTGSVSAAGFTTGGGISAGNISGGNISASGNLSAAGELQGNALRQRNCRWSGASPGNTADNQFHSTFCAYGEYAVGWRCYATEQLDGQCSMYCCTP